MPARNYQAPQSASACRFVQTPLYVRAARGRGIIPKAARSSEFPAAMH
jgi:hypothetical protein